MIYALVAGLLGTITAFAWLLDRKDQRATNERSALLALVASEQQAHRREVADLLQRVQAPERAVVQHEVKQAVELEMPQPPQSDEDYEDYRKQQEFIRAMEASENAHLQGRA